MALADACSSHAACRALLRTRSLWITSSLPETLHPSFFLFSLCTSSVVPSASDVSLWLTLAFYIHKTISAASRREKAKQMWLEGKMRLGGGAAACLPHIIHPARGIFVELRGSEHPTGALCPSPAPASFSSLFPRPEKHLCNFCPNKVTCGFPVLF